MWTSQEEDIDQTTPGKEIWRKKCGQQVSGTAGGRWRWQAAQDRSGWRQSVTYAAL